MVYFLLLFILLYYEHIGSVYHLRTVLYCLFLTLIYSIYIVMKIFNCACVCGCIRTFSCCSIFTSASGSLNVGLVACCCILLCCYIMQQLKDAFTR